MKLHLNKQKQLGSAGAVDYALALAIFITIFTLVLKSGGTLAGALETEMDQIVAGVQDINASGD